mmetsp:Transcript_12376/g.26732  ORF Transcript_12376/g.26732 Transcript_12376/m.26732 type:complete len:409 (-) Transcript_12376:598-1824(-)|eukprot:CAMPEP_0202902348 /NCGR_PEP_ID=MMETSP1392-20130828/16800_1 /ASSEMBLY_ACC=CAM_ASM_000868 /TAXON_ID=225041 /ORGANISM="Chlamydomonas chlamydogama, Strain SAG 11-48b" /LENGTH=408 /DNA_ID=CAMNT_0049589097 /DNA_START=66 /DNA_END=1292 /DNA_ORIENTATION=+
MAADRSFLDAAISKCPFLHNVCKTNGPEYAASIAINPTLPAPGPRRPILEETHDFAGTFRLFHGPSGLVPLKSERCPTIRSEPTYETSALNAVPNAEISQPPVSRIVPCNAPLASLSLGMPDFGGLFRRFQQQHHNQNHHQRRPLRQPKADFNKPGPANSSSSSSTLKPSGNSAGPGATAPSSGASNAAQGGTCPMRKVLGPFAGVIFNSSGHLQCPEPIIKARAALAATQPVRNLRPQALPIKVVAVMGTAAALNVPCGMWREHTKKFSFDWFVAVHATIPFIAMLRKAVIMPKYAILFTIAAAVAGQAMGARMERKRMTAQLAGETAAAAAPVRHGSVASMHAPPLLRMRPKAPATTQRHRAKAMVPSSAARGAPAACAMQVQQAGMTAETGQVGWLGLPPVLSSR